MYHVTVSWPSAVGFLNGTNPTDCFFRRNASIMRTEICERISEANSLQPHFWNMFKVHPVVGSRNQQNGTIAPIQQLRHLLTPRHRYRE